MKFPMTAIALALAATGMAAPATATVAVQDEAAEQEGPQYDLSRKGRKAIFPLQQAVMSAQWDQVPALAAAALEAAKTPDDTRLTQRLLIKAAVDQQKYADAIAPIEALAAMGDDVSTFVPIMIEIGKIRLNEGNADGAAEVLERALQLSPGNSDALVVLAETRVEQGRTEESVKLFNDALAAAKAEGTVDENWYKRAVQIAFEANSPSVYPLTREWVRAYPTKANWRDALRIYMNMSNADPSTFLDLMRLQHALGAMEGERDYLYFAEELLRAGYPGEAMAVIEAGKAANAFDMEKRVVKEILAIAEREYAGDRASLDGDFDGALSASEASRAVKLGDAYYGYGEYQKAAELYRAAIGKTGADADLANLRLGMTLARSGDYAAAKAALEQVGGKHAEYAAYWLAWVDTQM